MFIAPSLFVLKTDQGYGSRPPTELVGRGNGGNAVACLFAKEMLAAADIFFFFFLSAQPHTLLV